jgi:hypothetical protein
VFLFFFLSIKKRTNLKRRGNERVGSRFCYGDHLAWSFRTACILQMTEYALLAPEQCWSKLLRTRFIRTCTRTVPDSYPLFFFFLLWWLSGGWVDKYYSSVLCLTCCLSLNTILFVKINSNKFSNDNNE